MTLLSDVHGPALLILASGTAVFAAAIASYLGVVAERGWSASADGRSVCVCGRQLDWWENIPVVSWVILRGRCRCRKVRVPARYVVSEAGLAAAMVVALVVAGGLAALAALVAGGAVVLQTNRRAARRGGPVCADVGDGCGTAAGCGNCAK